MKLKQGILVLLILGGMTSCNDNIRKEVDISQLAKLDGRYYKKSELEKAKKYTGKVIEYSQSESDKVIGEINVKNGLLDGSIIGYREDGTLQFVQNYHEGKLDGLTTGYFQDGITPRYEREFKDGAAGGVFRLYYESGQVKIDEFYIDNQIDGIAYLYNEDGTLLEKTTYENGRFIEKEEYSVGGEREKEEVGYILNVENGRNRIEKVSKKLSKKINEKLE